MWGALLPGTGLKVVLLQQLKHFEAGRPRGTWVPVSSQPRGMPVPLPPRHTQTQCLG